MATQYTPILQLALPVTGELNGTWGDVVNNNITSMVEEAIAGLATINTWTANSHTMTTVDGLTDEARCAMIVAQTGAGGTALTASGEIICPARTKLYVVSNQSAYQVTIKTAAGTGIAVAAGDTTFVFCDGTNVLACVTQITNGHVTGNLTVDGNTTLGNATSDTITATGRFNSDVLPSADNAYDLGTVGNSWRNLYIDGTATIATLNVTTIDTTNLEVTNIKAKDGTASITLADSTGVATLSANPILSGGTANGVAYLNGSKVLTTGSALTFDGTNLSINSSNALRAADIGSSVQAYDADLTSWAGIAPSAKQDTLVSGTNIKTVGGTTLLGSGDVPLPSATLTIDNKTGAYTVVATDLGKIINCTANSFTVALTAAATLGAGFNCWVWNTSNTATDAITIDPNGTETIDGRTTLILRRGEGLQIVCDGTNWQTGDKKVMRVYAENSSATEVRPTVTGSASVAIGSGATASGANSFAAGFYASVTNTNSLALGRQASASGSDSIAIGQLSNASGNSSISIGYNTPASASRAMSIGYGANALATDSTAIGQNSTGNGSQAATGSGAMALGGSYASGIDSFAAAIGNNTSTYGAQGLSSTVLGLNSKATNNYGAVLGRLHVSSGDTSACLGGQQGTASGFYSTTVGGISNTASGNYSVAFGAYNTASGSASYALGLYANASLMGKTAFSSGRFGSNGDAQTGKMVLRQQTTDATPSILTADQAAPANTNQVILPNYSTYAFTILVVARRTNATNESAGYKFEGVVDRNANAASTAIVGTVAKTVLAEDTAAWDVNVTADTTNGGLAITVTGEAGKTIRWVATCWTSEVTS